MPNSYATVPNILPGNVTIGGNLTVGGDQIRIGAAAPFTRLAKVPAGGAALSYNLDNLLLTTDAASRNLQLAMVANASKAFSTRDHDGVGGQNSGDLPVVWGWTPKNANFTGSLVETTQFSVSIRGGFLGVNGGFRFRWGLFASVQGGVATTFRVKLGATTLATLTSAVAENRLIEGQVINSSIATAQTVFVYSERGATLEAPAATTAAENTANTLTFAFTIQLGAVGDNWTSWIHGMEPVRCSN